MGPAAFANTLILVLFNLCPTLSFLFTMHLFDHPEFASQAVLGLMGQHPSSVRAAGRGGRNTVFEATLDDGSRWAVRMGSPDSGPEFVSGLGWARALAARGVPAVVPIHVDAEGKACGLPCTIAPWSDGRDAEKVVSSLTPDQLCGLGRTMASWSVRMLPMIEDYLATGVGLLRFGSHQASHTSWLEYLHGNAEWRLGRALANPAWAAPIDQALLRSMGATWLGLHPAIDAAPLSLLAWDIGDRNVMVNSTGIPVALVDVDELMVGDALMAPALAWAGMAFQRLPLDHVMAWEEALPWQKSTDYQLRLLACKGYFLMNFSSKVGLQSATGLTEVGSCTTARALILDWMESIRTTLSQSS